MRYVTYIILFCILLPSHQEAHAQELRYRVELLVLRHLEGYSSPQPVTGLTDFSAALDLLAPSLESPVPEQAGVPPVQAVSPPLPAILLQETPGEVMQQAWRRLRSANGFRPELYFSWEQASNAGAPEIRIHDQVLVFAQHPDAGAQSVRALQPASAVKTSPEEATMVSAGQSPQVPQFYRLDGTARLRVSRFLHLDLNIEYREPLDESGTQAGAISASGDSSQAAPGATTFLVHTIHQSRQLHIQDLQYFDGPVIAVLATVSRVEPSPEQSQ